MAEAALLDGPRRRWGGGGSPIATDVRVTDTLDTSKPFSRTQAGILDTFNSCICQRYRKQKRIHQHGCTV